MSSSPRPKPSEFSNSTLQNRAHVIRSSNPSPSQLPPTRSGSNKRQFHGEYTAAGHAYNSDWKIDFFNLLHFKGCEIFLDVWTSIL
ncbi:hypothetical protein H5410_006299 [Solanum commersonii]|uniref:Uncharacterized protein n=1 Tax=Solanum commersonii TaxID=4109 RepID=A0A9J6A9B8_SOLCO|nr:hypothetical protein H5410_006299 [Solanum commersonii]